MNKTFITTLCFLAVATTMTAQYEDDIETDGLIAGYFDTGNQGSLSYSEFKLPPLSILFENAQSNPTVERLAVEESIQRELIKKEILSPLKYVTGHANYTYGIMDNYGSNSTVTTPIYFQYMGSKQTFWNFGASLNVPLDDAFDYFGRVRRQRLQTEKARLDKEMAYNELKQQIATLYVRITNNIVALKTAGENAAAYKGAGELTNEEFKMGEVSVRALAETKRWENDAIGTYQDLQSRITTDILVLEILTHTPIITNVVVDTKLNKKK